MLKMNKNTRNGFCYGFSSILANAGKLRVLLVLAIVGGTVFAQGEVGIRLYDLLNFVCGTLVMLLPVVALSLLVMAAVVYGIGQVFGSEMKSKAQSWAMGMIVGMLISLIIWLVSKPLITMLLGEENLGNLPTDFCTPQWGE
jgi:ABC-type multidrug transport system permease subunit